MMTMIKKYWWVLLALPLGVISVILAVRLIKRKPKTDDVKADQVFDQIGVSNSDRARLNKAAAELATHLGTVYPWYDPRRWSEDDRAAFMVLKSLKQSEFDIVKQLYSQVYAKGRTLMTDIVKFLNTEYYEQLNLN